MDIGRPVLLKSLIIKSVSWTLFNKQYTDTFWYTELRWTWIHDKLYDFRLTEPCLSAKLCNYTLGFTINRTRFVLPACLEYRNILAHLNFRVPRVALCLAKQWLVFVLAGAFLLEAVFDLDETSGVGVIQGGLAFGADLDKLKAKYACMPAFLDSVRLTSSKPAVFGMPKLNSKLTNNVGSPVTFSQ